MIRAVAVLAACAACSGDVDEPWQLDHDRIIAVRATPPRIPAGGRAELDALIGRKGARAAEAVPSSVRVVTPASLAGTLRTDGGRWLVEAPASLAAVRAELGLAADAPVPLVVEVAVGGGAFPSGGAPGGFASRKTVWLGEAAGNPVLDTADVDGGAGELVVGRDVDVPLAISAGDTDDTNWLTSCGSMHDYDLARAYLRVEPDDPGEGELAVVVRTALGGVAWRTWTLRVE